MTNFMADGEAFSELVIVRIYFNRVPIEICRTQNQRTIFIEDISWLNVSSRDIAAQISPRSTVRLYSQSLHNLSGKRPDSTICLEESI